MEIINNKQAVSIIAIFIMGSTFLIGTAKESGSAGWIAILLAVIISVPIILIYARILNNHRGKDIFDIFEIVFGKIIGKVFSGLFILYSFLLGSLVIRNFGEFITIEALPETPMLVSLIAVGILSIMSVYNGIEVISRTTYFFVPFIFILIFVVSLLSITEMKIDNLKPILGNGFSPILKGAISTVFFPLAETVVLMGSMFFALKKNDSIYRTFLVGLLIGGGLILLVVFRNTLVLGSELSEITNFSSHRAISRINIGNFVQRIEVTVSIVFVLCVFVKASICLLATCKGISKIFEINNYRPIVLHVGLLMILFSSFVFEDSIHMINFAFKAYPYYAFPFQIIIPVVVLVVSEIKKKKAGKANKNSKEGEMKTCQT